MSGRSQGINQAANSPRASLINDSNAFMKIGSHLREHPLRAKMLSQAELTRIRCRGNLRQSPKNPDEIA
jgi:hypothetical protein